MQEYKDLLQSLNKKQYTWLITGIAGFIGSNLLETLLIHNQKVVGLDNFDTGYKRNIDYAIEDAERKSFGLSTGNIRNNFTFQEGDIRDLSTCIEACKGVDFILHQAALGSVPRSIEDPINTNRANIDGFLNVLVAARDENVKGFVYAASSSTYGDHKELPKQENRIGKPLSPYAVTKLVNELYAEVFSRNYNFNCIGLRYFNIFGKRQDPNGAYAAVIPKWISCVINNENVFINGDGETSRDFCYIDNVIQMNLLSAMTKNEKAKNQVYNVALNNRTSLNHLYHLIQEKLIARLPSLTKKNPVYRDFRSGDVRHSQANIEKAKILLGYDPQYQINEGLEEAMDWYVSNLAK